MEKIVYFCLIAILLVQCDRTQKTELWICEEEDYQIQLQLYDNNSFHSTVVGDCHRNDLCVLFADDTWYDYTTENDSIINISHIRNSNDSFPAGDYFTFHYSRSNDTITLRYLGIHDCFVNYVTQYKFVTQ